MKNSRREFLQKAWAILPAAALSALAFPFYRFVDTEHKYKKITIPLDRLDDYITDLKNPPLFIVRTKKSYKVFDAHCTHMGCIVNYNKKDRLFECPCHGSVFNLDGKRLKGPAKKSLKQLTFKIIGNDLIIG